MKKIYLLISLIAFAINFNFANALHYNANLASESYSPEVMGAKLSMLIVDFSASDTLTCSGIVRFTDLSANGAIAWVWRFGDGATSNVQNPQHTYTTTGYFTVTLLTVSSIGGLDSIVKTDYIHVDFLIAPTVSPDTSICQYNSATLTASGNGQIAWYDSSAAGNMLDTGSVFITPTLTTSTTFYAATQQSQPSYFGGPADSALGGGSFYNQMNNRYLIFNCISACRLVSVLVYAQGAGQRTVNLADSTGNIIQTRNVNVPDGMSRIYLNFDIQPGNNYRLANPGNSNFYRNNGGAVYPYNINNLVSITGNNGFMGYYYFFYDWEVSLPACVSPRIPVTVTVTPGPQASFIYNQNANVVNCTNLSLGTTNILWNFGDGATSTLTAPSHTYTALGTYTLTLTASNGTCSSTQTVTINVTGFVGIDEVNSLQVSLAPNPVKDILTINVPENINKASFELSNNVGQLVFTKNISDIKNHTSINFETFKPGVYLLKITSYDKVAFRKIVKL